MIYVKNFLVKKNMKHLQLKMLLEIFQKLIFKQKGEDIYLKNKVRKKSGSLYSKSLYMNYDGVLIIVQELIGNKI